jgi:DNA polymerase III subunit beta
VKLTIPSSRTLADAVGWVAKALPSRPSVPVLAAIRITVTDGAVVLEGFDYETSTRTGLDATVAEPGTALVSGRLLADITKALPGKPVDITTAGAHLELVCGSARFTLPTMPVEDYPALPAMPAPVGTVNATLFAAAVAQVAVAASHDGTLPMMTGVRIERSGGTLALLATDRYRLALREIPWTPGGADADGEALVPAGMLADTAKALGPAGGDVTIALSGAVAGEGVIGFEAGGRRTTSRLLDGANYPPVRSLFPEPDKVQAGALLDVHGLTEVVKRVALVAERATPVRLGFSADGLVVEAGGSEDARASEATDAAYTGEPLTIAFNPQYLLDGLASMGSAQAVLSLVDSFKPAVLSPALDDGTPDPAHRYLLMPIRVQK